MQLRSIAPGRYKRQTRQEQKVSNEFGEARLQDDPIDNGKVVQKIFEKNGVFSEKM